MKNRILATVLSVTMMLGLFNSTYCLDEYIDNPGIGIEDGQIKIDGKNYSKSIDGTFTFGTNVFHSRFFGGEVQFPLREVWKKKVTNNDGDLAKGQPVITDDFIILTVEDSIMVLDREDGTIITQPGGGDRLQIQKGSGLDPIYSSPFYLSNESKWLLVPKVDDPTTYVKDQFSHLFFATKDGYVYNYQLAPNGKLYMDPVWISNNGADGTSPYKNDAGGIDLGVGSKGISSSPIMVLDESTNRPTLILSTGNGKVFAIDIPTGNVADVWPDLNELEENPADFDRIESFSSPIAYQRNLEGNKLSNFSNCVIGFEDEASEKGFISGFYVDSGDLLEIRTFHKTTYYEDILGSDSYRIPTSIGVVEKVMDDGFRHYLFMYSDERGNIYCYDQKTEQILFKIDKYGKEYAWDSRNTPTIVQNDDGETVYAIFTLSVDPYNKKGKVVCVDVNHALEEVENGNKHPNNAIYWETNSNDFAGKAYSGSSAIAMLNMKDEASQAMIIAVDRGDDENKHNMHAYYVDTRDGNEPAKVENAFMNDKGEFDSGLYIPGGIYGEPAFMAERDEETGDFTGGFLIVTSGDGYVHAFKYEPINNLIVSDFYKKTTSETPDYSFENGDTVTVSVDIVNQFGVAFEDVKMDLNFDRDRKGQQPKLMSYQVFKNGNDSPDGVIEVNDKMVEDNKNTDVVGYEGIYDEEEYPKNSGHYIDVWDGFGKGYFQFDADIGPQGSRIDFTFEIPDGYSKSEFDMFVRANYDEADRHPVEEVDGVEKYDDNEAELTLSSAQYDFTIRNMNVPDVRTGDDVFVSFDVANDSDKDWNGSNLYLSINVYDESNNYITGQVGKLEDFVYSSTLRANTQRSVMTYIDLGSDSIDGRRYRVRAFIDCYDNVNEKNEDNNTKSKYFNISDNADFCKGNNLHSEKTVTFSWTSDGTEPDYNGGNQGSRRTVDTVHHYDSEGNYEGTTYYYERDVVYSSDMKMSVQTSKTSLKSGYGFKVEAQVEVTTDIADFGSVSPCRDIRVYVYDSEWNELEYKMDYELVNVATDSSDKHLSEFQLKQNSESKFNERKIFIPLDFPDGKYNVRVCTGAVNGAGPPMFASKSFDIEIEGHMYEDTNTRPTN